MISDRRLSDNTPVNPNIRQEFHLENRFSFRTIQADYFLYFELRTFQEKQDNIDILIDSKASQTSFRTDITYFASSNDQFDLQMDFIKYQYDTPAIENYEDRDHITFISRLRYLHKFTPLLSVDFSGYLNMSHKIYLARQQSANNNWDRTYKAQSTVRYRYLNWRNTLRTEVLANYIVYDFDELFVNKRSVVFRQYSVSDSINIPLIHGLQLGVYVRFELKDMGSFFKELFAQNILGSWQTLFMDISFIKENFLNLIFELGCAWYDSKNWRNISEVTESRSIKRLSPHLRVRYPFGKNLYLSGHISHHYQNDVGYRNTEFTYGRMDLTYQF